MGRGGGARADQGDIGYQVMARQIQRHERCVRPVDWDENRRHERRPTATIQKKVTSKLRQGVAYNYNGKSTPKRKKSPRWRGGRWKLIALMSQ